MLRPCRFFKIGMPSIYNMKKNLFITDFDGTLLTDDKTIADQDIATLTQLQARGVTTAIATGRSIYSFNRALDQIDLNGMDLPVDYLIFSTGAGILALAKDAIIQSHSILMPDILKICSYFDDVKLDYMVHKAIPDTPYFLYKSHGKLNPDFQKRIELYQRFAAPLNRDTSMFTSATQVLAVIPGGVSVSKMTVIKSALADFSVIHATSPLDHSSAWIEVFNKAVSKSQAAARLAAKLNIKQKHVISVGNDYNDQDLLEWSGEGYLVANAAQDLKLCFRTVESNNHCGVTRAAQLSGLLDEQPVESILH